ncbi:MAG: MBL fold metallo-hydrolase [Clostridiales bacterium]|nr:MBL fold metallo-hydrolase [Clostridiales bacterium]
MQIIRISPRGFGANAYVITQDGKEAIVIDPAQRRVEGELLKLGLTAKYVLLTHCHFDHVGGVAALQAAGAKVLCGEKEKSLCGTSADLYDAFGAPREPFYVDETLKDGETRILCGVSVQTLFTPGHTAGGACYLIADDKGDRHLFTGDTLFAGSIGRTDFPTGSIGALRDSLKKLASLDGDMAVYPGHQEETTLEEERKTNPFMVDL